MQIFKTVDINRNKQQGYIYVACFFNSELTMLQCLYDRSLAKVLIGGGAVYVTLDQGIWSSSTHGSSALQRVRKNVLPDTSEYLNKVSHMYQAL